MKTKQTVRKDSQQKSSSDMLTSALKAQISVVVSAVLLLLAFCAVSSSMEDPDSIIKPLSLTALFLSALFGGLTAVRLSGDGLVSGLLSGGITALLVLLFSLLPFPSTDKSIPETLLSFLCIIASSAAGSLLGKKRKTKKKPPQRRLKR